MTCQECEIKLGMGENAAEHLASCAECRRLAEDLRLNSIALGEMKVRPVVRWAWALAAAAAVLMAVFVWRAAPRGRLRQADYQSAAGYQPAPQKPAMAVQKPRRRRHSATAPAEPLRVKMFTSDPDVVIYWIVDKKEGYE
jgi:hypothetical protein